MIQNLYGSLPPCCIAIATSIHQGKVDIIKQYQEMNINNNCSTKKKKAHFPSTAHL